MQVCRLIYFPVASFYLAMSIPWVFVAPRLSGYELLIHSRPFTIVPCRQLPEESYATEPSASSKW